VRALLAAFWLRYLRYPWSRINRASLERRRALLPLTPASLEDVAAALRQIVWTQDGPLHLFDCISSPERTWYAKRDDCDGFAAVAASLLARLDASSDPKLLTVVVLPLRRSHTVCVFRTPAGHLRMFDNARLPDSEFASYEEVARYVAERGETAVCWDLVRPADLRSVEFHRFA
jgi:hypothetical protein